MIISKTPYRISFFGGGTDYPDWYRENGGQVLSTTINKYIYISCRNLPPFFDHKLRLVYSIIEEVQDSSEIDHPAAREVLNFLQTRDGMEIHYDGDLPGKSGMGSSSSFTVGLLKTIYGFNGTTVKPRRLAEEAIHIEQNIIGETVGSQDQIAASIGGFNHIKFKGDSFTVDPISIPETRLTELDSNIMLFFTGIQRFAEKIAKTYVNDIKARERQLNLMYQMVDEGKRIINTGDLDDFGHLLDQTWQRKKELSREVSNQTIDDIYDLARKSGALGGKISGAGGGGFMFFYVPIEKQEQVKKNLSQLIHVPFKFESVGSRIIFSGE